MWGWDGMGGIFMMMFMMLIMVLFWGFVIVGIVFAIRALSGSRTMPGTQPERRDTALEALKERYAKGEIDTAEYEEKKRELAS
jgi:putative membrane protein